MEAGLHNDIPGDSWIA